MIVYLQGPDGQEMELDVNEPDPADGSYVLPIDAQHVAWPVVIGQGWWLRIVTQ